PLRPFHVVFRLPPAPRLLLVDRHLRAEHRNDFAVSAAGGFSPFLPRFSQAQIASLPSPPRGDPGAGPPPETRLADLPVRKPGTSVSGLFDSARRISLRRPAGAFGSSRKGSLRGAAVLLDTAGRLSRAGAGGARTLGPDARRPPRAPSGLSRFRRNDSRD